MIGIKIDPEKLKCGITVRPQSCVRMYYKNASCNLCVELCPENAVKVGMPGTRVLVNPSKCSSCEICVGACPYGVFTVSGTNDYIRCVNLLESTYDQGLKLACGKSETKDAVKIECLGSLNSVLLLFLLTSGVKKIELDMEPCVDCEISEYMHKILNKELEITRSMLRYVAAGYKEYVIENAMLIMLENDIFQKAQKTEISCSRRGFFNHMKKNVLKSMSVITEIIESDPVERVVITDKKPVNNRKHIANMIYDRLVSLNKNIPMTAGFPIGKIFVNNTDCTQCRVCEKLCPTGSILIDDGAFKHNVYKCIGCGVCVDLCSRNCIKLPTEK
jgi:Pyruvate/2-oxoacid:ferredoxin oxidoreductase delta subunit